MLRIKALGCLTVIGTDGPFVGGAAQPKRMALLAFLARAGERGITRDKMLGYFWPDAEEDRARRSLANAVWALRRDLGEEELFLPGNDLRLNPGVITSDVEEFETAMAAGDVDRAATLYEGPFLDGFRLAGAPEFDRWVDAERAALAHRYAVAAEKLARAAEANGRADAAVVWWRKLAAHDPLNSRLAIGLMRALAAAGDRTGAVRHAQIYEALVDQELDLPPDREVVAFARQLRDDPTFGASSTDRTDITERPAPATRKASPAAAHVATSVAAATQSDAAVALANTPAAAETATVEPGRVSVAEPAPTGAAKSPTSDAASPRTVWQRWLPRRLPRRSWVLRGVGVIAAVFLLSRVRIDSDAKATPVLALGQITDYRTDRSTELVKPLTDMLATALARSPAVQVVSNARMYEVANRNGGGGRSPPPDTYVSAARLAGANELLAGALYAVNDSTLRLDLQRIDLSTGRVRGSHSVTARDPFALADSGTSRLLAALGAEAPEGSIADVMTRSLTAYRFYDEGLRAFYMDDLVSAERLFKAALTEDSTFASAAFYLARSYRQDEAANSYPMLERAVRLSAHAAARERLCIRAYWEERTSSPSLRATTESLLVRFPQEVEGYFFTGIVRHADGDFLGAVPFLERAIVMDSLSLRGAQSACTACEAFQWLVSAYVLADSVERAHQVVRRWLTLQPRSGLAYAWLTDVLGRKGRVDDAIAAWRERSQLAPGYEANEVVIARLYIQAGEYEKADEVLRSLVTTGSAARRVEANWVLGISARYQGRIREALRYAQEEQRVSRVATPAGTAPNGGRSEAQALQELGRGRDAATIFDAFARWNPGTIPRPEVAPGMIGRHRAWNFTHAASALASVGDTATLPARADTIGYYGRQSLSKQHRDLHHHVRGLILAARHRDDEAIAEFRQALYSASGGYTRTNYELGRVLLRQRRPAEAVTIVTPAVRGDIEAAAYYVTQVELHELLAQAWDSLGTAAPGRATRPPRVTAVAARDSAVHHYRWVARAWANGDPPFAARARQAEARAKAIARQ